MARDVSKVRSVSDVEMIADGCTPHLVHLQPSGLFEFQYIGSLSTILPLPVARNSGCLIEHSQVVAVWASTTWLRIAEFFG